VRHHIGKVTCLVLLGGLIGCSDSSGTEALEICTNPVTLTVGAGTTPKISWSPACLANQVVINEQGGGPAWAMFFVVDSNPLRPPVHYGVVQAGALGTPTSPAPLTAGTTYNVNLFVDPVGGPAELIGTKSVTP